MKIKTNYKKKAEVFKDKVTSREAEMPLSEAPVKFEHFCNSWLEPPFRVSDLFQPQYLLTTHSLPEGMIVAQGSGEKRPNDSFSRDSLRKE